jgi:hypothetical protein
MSFDIVWLRPAGVLHSPSLLLSNHFSAFLYGFGQQSGSQFLLLPSRLFSRRVSRGLEGQIKPRMVGRAEPELVRRRVGSVTLGSPIEV